MISFEQTARQKNISGKEVHHEMFKGINLSNKPVKILYKGSSCSCTVGKVPLEPIQPNELFEVEIIVNKVGHTGRYSTSVSLTFSDGSKSKEIKLQLSGQIEE